MPRNTRNFWLDASIDGSKKDIGTGPRNKDGGFYLTIKQRDEGGIITSATINGTAHSDGTLTLSIRPMGGETIIVETKR